jgi:hypothetical protein
MVASAPHRGLFLQGVGCGLRRTLFFYELE